MLTTTGPDMGITLTEPIFVDGYKCWIVNGRLRPAVSGGDEGEAGANDEGEGEGESEGDELTLEERLAKAEAEAEKWKSQSRKHEGRAKANSGAQKELDELKKKHANDDERARLEAEEAGRAVARAELAPKLLAAEVRAAAGDRMTKDAREALLDGLDATKFLNDDGDVDTDKVAALIEGIAGPQSDTDDDDSDRKKRFPDLGQGRRSGGKASKADAGKAEAERRFGKQKAAAS